MPLPRGTETILLVEDQPEVRQFASTCLKSFGYHVIEAENGEEALQLLRQASARSTCCLPMS